MPFENGISHIYPEPAHRFCTVEKASLQPRIISGVITTANIREKAFIVFLIAHNFLAALSSDFGAFIVVPIFFDAKRFHTLFWHYYATDITAIVKKRGNVNNMRT